MARHHRRSSKSRGEVNEVINQLERLCAKDGRKPDVIQAKKECFQKLIRYMTQGIDMSAAFIPATKCVALSKSDVPLKKMLYLYLRTAARQNAEVALLVVQALLTDCKDADPTIRGLAVRSMASLRVPDLIENALQAVEQGMKDLHPYVREAAVMGVLKCHHQDPAASKIKGLIHTVIHLLQTDSDPQVVADALYVAREMHALPGGIPDRAIIVSLLNHIKVFSEWAQCFVLSIVARYHPETEEERFDILEILDFGLNHPNSAVVMETAHVFLQYTLNHPEQHSRVLETLRDPIQTLAQGREPEIAYAALSNLLVLAKRAPHAFRGLYADFFVRSADPSYLKGVKIEILVALADPGNAHDIADELTQYAKDSDVIVARAAVGGLAAVAAKAPSAHGILDRLLFFLDDTIERPAAASEAIVQMAIVLRRFPDAVEACVAALSTVNESDILDTAARAAYVYILGELGEKIQDAPYVLESMIESFTAEPMEMKLALITAIGKLFFKRAPECRAALGKVLSLGAKEGDTTVRDLAMLYYRLLKTPQSAEAIIHAPRPIPCDGGALSSEALDRIFDELNSLSVIFRAPASSFIEAQVPTNLGEIEEIGEVEGPLAEELNEEMTVANTMMMASLLDLDTGGDGSGPPSHEASTADLTSIAHPIEHIGNPMDLLGGLMDVTPLDTTTAMQSFSDRYAEQQPQEGGGGLEDLFGGFGLGDPPSQNHQSEDITLAISPQSFSQSEFQQGWSAWPSQSFDIQIDSISPLESNNFRNFVEHIRQANIASFAVPSAVGASFPYRFLFHAQTSSASRILAQISVAQSGAVNVTVRSDDGAARNYVTEVLQTLLLSL